MLQSFLCIGPFDQTWVHYATLGLGAMILHEVESFLGPLKSFGYPAYIYIKLKDLILKFQL